MAKAKSTGKGLHLAAIRLADGDENDAPPADSFEASEAELLSKIAAEGGDAHHEIRVFQLDFDNTKRGQPSETYLKTIGPEELDTLWDQLRDEFGTGTYRYRVRRRIDGRGVNQIGQVTRAVRASPRSVPVVQQASPDALAAMIAKQNADLVERLTARMAPAPSLDIVGAFTVFAQMQETFAKRFEAQAPAAASDPMKMIGLFEKGIEFAQSLAPGAGAAADDGLAGIAKTALQSGVLERIAEIFRGGTRAGAPALQAPGAEQGSIAAPAAPAAAQQYLTDVLRHVAGMAARREEVSVAAEFVLENLAPAMVDQLLNTPNLVDTLAIAMPGEVGPHRGFFAALLQEVKKYMMPPDATQPLSPPLPSGEVPNGPANGHGAGDAQVDEAYHPQGAVNGRRAASSYALKPPTS